MARGLNYDTACYLLIARSVQFHCPSQHWLLDPSLAFRLTPMGATSDGSSLQNPASHLCRAFSEGANRTEPCGRMEIFANAIVVPLSRLAKLPPCSFKNQTGGGSKLAWGMTIRAMALMRGFGIGVFTKMLRLSNGIELAVNLSQRHCCQGPHLCCVYVNLAYSHFGNLKKPEPRRSLCQLAE